MKFPAPLRIHLMGLRVVVAALLMGPVMFFAAGFVLGKDAGVEAGRLLTWIGLGVGLVALALRGPLRHKLAARGRRTIRDGSFQPHGAMTGEAWEHALAESGDVARLYSIYQSCTVIPAGILETGILVCGLGFFISGVSVALAVGASLTAVQAFLHWPREDAVTAWLDNQQQLLARGE